MQHGHVGLSLSYFRDLYTHRKIKSGLEIDLLQFVSESEWETGQQRLSQSKAKFRNSDFPFDSPQEIHKRL